MARPFDLTGRRFGRLLAVERAGSTPKGRALWRCQCDCGAETITQASYLTHGHTRSCGCLHIDSAVANGRARKIDLTGRTFGRLTVMRENGRYKRHEVRWLCHCSCGRETTMTGSRLTGGHNRSCGCLRDELRRARAAAVGSAKRVKDCRTCGQIYEATGSQKECSDACRREWHAADEARRRGERDIQEFAATATKLQRRLDQ